MDNINIQNRQSVFMKQAIIIRTDLKMDKGKIAAQAAHASVTAFMNTPAAQRKEWLETGMKKIVLKVNSREELFNIFNSAKKQKLPAALITDAGKTQIEPGSHTAVGIGPASEAKIDNLAGHLKLL